MIYYHVSQYELDIGTVLRPRPNYEEYWGSEQWYQILEQIREKHFPDELPHKKSVFMGSMKVVKEFMYEDVKFIYVVEPQGIVYKRDLECTKAIQFCTEQPYIQQKAALKYWKGKRYHKYVPPLWEYITTSAVVISRQEY